MRTNQFLLDLLSCPDCGKGLGLGDTNEQADDGHVMSGTLHCTSCSASFPIVGGVPRLTPTALSAAVERDMTGWTYEWQHTEHVLEDTPLNAADTFLDFIHPVEPDHFRGKAVLDAGCGSGRFSRWAAEFGASAVLGVDLSGSVDVAFANLRSYENVIIVQADLLSLPLSRRFDYAFSVGVLDHTADPRGAFDSVVSRVRPGGSISVWVYGREGNGWIVHILNPIRRKVTSRLPRGILLGLSYMLSLAMFPILKGFYRPAGRLKWLAPLKRLLFYFDYLYYFSGYRVREQAIIVFDHLAPGIVEYVSSGEFAEWFDGNELRDIIISSRNGNSWRGFGIQPSITSTGGSNRGDA